MGGGGGNGYYGHKPGLVDQNRHPVTCATDCHLSTHLSLPPSATPAHPWWRPTPAPPPSTDSARVQQRSRILSRFADSSSVAARDALFATHAGDDEHTGRGLGTGAGAGPGAGAGVGTSRLQSSSNHPGALPPPRLSTPARSSQGEARAGGVSGSQWRGGGARVNSDAGAKKDTVGVVTACGGSAEQWGGEHGERMREMVW